MIRPAQLTRFSIMGLRVQSAKPCNMDLQKGRFYSHQESLPRLPVPSLWRTLDKYLKTVKPLITDNEFENTKKLVEKFVEPQGFGDSLQTKLLEHASQKENWLSDWWLDCAYLESRASVVVYCSPSVSFPRYNFSGTKGQIAQAAKVIAGILNYKINIDNETLPIDKMGNAALCMDQYYRILSSCRVPGLEKDEVHCYARSWRPPRHIVVVHNNHFFELDVYHTDGNPLTIKELDSQLTRIVDASPEPAQQIGILTSRDRDNWGRVHQILSKDEQNHRNLCSIQRSIVLVCLDQDVPAVPEEAWRSDLSGRCLHGGGSQFNSGNRWFDKTIQMVVDKSGGVGLVYEHSTAEGPPIVALLDHVHKYCGNPETQSRSSLLPLPHPKELVFNVPGSIAEEITNAGKELDKSIANLNLTVVDFKEFGKNFIKTQKLSPDSFIQMAFQLAYYRLHRKAPATYESGSLRRFRLGRTDTIRSCTIASDIFTKAMVNKSASIPELGQMLRDAVAAHKQYTNEAINGQAIDRHLLGLRLVAQKSGLEVPEIFRDNSYKQAMSFNLSTSQVPCEADLSMAFGPAIIDGYGICYNPKNDHILLSVSSFKDNPNYDVEPFYRELVATLSEMRDILIASSSKL